MKCEYINTRGRRKGEACGEPCTRKYDEKYTCVSHIKMFEKRLKKQHVVEEKVVEEKVVEEKAVDDVIELTIEDPSTGRDDDNSDEETTDLDTLIKEIEEEDKKEYENFLREIEVLSLKYNI